MPLCLPKHLLPSLESTLRRATLAVRRPRVPSEKAAGFAAGLSTETLLQCLDAAALLVAARVRAENVRELHEQRNPPSFGADIPIADTLRLRGTAVQVNGVIAHRETFASTQAIRARGDAASNANPRYVFEGGQLVIDSGAENAIFAAAGFVGVPLTTPTTEPGTLTGGSVSVSLQEYHDETVLYLRSGSDRYTARVTNGTAGLVQTSAPDGSYDITHVQHACSRLPDHLEGAIVLAAAQWVFASEGQEGASGLAEDVAAELAPRLMPGASFESTTDR